MEYDSLAFKSSLVDETVLIGYFTSLDLVVVSRTLLL